MTTFETQEWENLETMETPGEWESQEWGETGEYEGEQFLGGLLGSVLGGLGGGGELELTEMQETELATELLGLSSEEELEQFLGKLIRGAAKAVGKAVRSPVGRALGGALKNVAKTALPMAAGALGNLVLPGVGGAIGSRLGTRRHMSSYRAGRLFGPSWASTLDQRLEIEDDGVYFVAEDGRILVYPTPPATGEPVLPVEGARWPLTRTGDAYQIAMPDQGVTLHFLAGSATVLPTSTLPISTLPTSTLPISTIVSRYRHRIIFRYAPDGTLTEIRHSGGYRIAVDTADGLVTGLRLRTSDDSRGVGLLSYGYAGDRRLVSVTNSSGRALRFEYDHAGRIVYWQDRNDEWYRFHYDGKGRCHRTEGSGNALAGTLEFYEDTRVSVWTNSMGHQTAYHFNELGQIVREIDPLGNAVLSEWDRHDRLLSRTDPLGRTTRYEYDERGNLTTITRADGSQQLFEYNELGLPVAVVEPTGAVWRRHYDVDGNLTMVTDPAGAITRYGYDDRATLTTVIDPAIGVYRIGSDPLGLPRAITDPLGAVTRYERDVFGRITAIIDPAGGITRFGWTVEGQLLTRVRPDGTTQRWRYDGEGNHVGQIDALGRPAHVETTHFDLPATVTTRTATGSSTATTASCAW
jgi:YD repeat-containing protein